MEQTERFPKNLEVGMVVTAICMGRKVGEYNVLEVSSQFAWLGWEKYGDAGAQVVHRQVGPNGLLTLEHGGTGVQATDYFVKPL